MSISTSDATEIIQRLEQLPWYGLGGLIKLEDAIREVQNQTEQGAEDASQKRFAGGETKA